MFVTQDILQHKRWIRIRPVQMGSSWTEGFDWKGVWGVSTRYKVNDIMSGGGDLYPCTEKHIGGFIDGLELDNAKWDTLQEFRMERQLDSNNKIRINDVSYGGQVYVCNAGLLPPATNALGLEEPTQTGIP